MLPKLIAFCLARRPLVLISFTAFLGLGYAAFTVLNIEAYPDPAPPIIEIIAQYPGQSPEEMERYVTIPIGHSHGRAIVVEFATHEPSGRTRKVLSRPRHRGTWCVRPCRKGLQFFWQLAHQEIDR